MFREGRGTLADIADDDAGVVYLEDDDDGGAAKEPWDPDEEYNRKGA